MGLKNGIVELKYDYDNWKRMFEEEKCILEGIFGNLAISIQHVGSTSVRGLMSKPVVDIALSISKLEDVFLVRDRLEKLYTVKENFDRDEILLIKEENEVTYFLIHVMECDSRRYKDMISFRNFLRSNYEAMKRYEKFKVDLAFNYYNDRGKYTSGKSDFIQDVLKKL